jgi:hypothetical protein
MNFEFRLTNKKSFRKEIYILAELRPRKEILEMFALVLQQEHKKLATKTSRKAKKTKIILDESRDSSKHDMSIDHIMVSTRTRSIVRPKNKPTKRTKARLINSGL